MRIQTNMNENHNHNKGTRGSLGVMIVSRSSQLHYTDRVCFSITLLPSSVFLLRENSCLVWGSRSARLLEQRYEHPAIK